MDYVQIYRILQAALREFWRFRYVALLIGFVTGIALLALGSTWPQVYKTSATLYADEQNIISPLLKGRAEVTAVDDELQRVKDIMLSQKALEQIVVEQDMVARENDPAARSAAANGLRGAINVVQRGPGYIGINYGNVDPTVSFNVINMLVDLFIQQSSRNKRSESRQAFEFIDKQATSYKDQLRLAEERLKEFNAANLDGTEGQAQSAIESIRGEIESVQLDLEQAREKTSSLARQVAQEDRYLTQKARSDGYNERIVQAIAQLDELRLEYTDSHPDVIAMRQHIEALREASRSAGDSTVAAKTANVENPVYDQLRKDLATATVERNSVQRRLDSLTERLSEARARLKRIIAREAELKELTRDYDVTKGLYEDLLERKEQARLSMTLDIEGQGVTYKIQDPPEFPLAPSGLRFIHFALLGAIAGLLVPIALVVAYVLLDPRIRFPNVLQESFDLPVLGEVPHLSSGLQKRLNRLDLRLYLFMGLIACVTYAGLVAAYLFLVG